MMAVVMGTYYGFFIPLMLNYQIPKPPLVNIFVEKALYILFFLNGTVNPIVYGWLSPDFNKAFRSLLGLNSHRAPEQRSDTVTSTLESLSQVNTVSGQT